MKGNCLGCMNWVLGISKPSSPYRNWTTEPSLSLTVRSYWTTKPSRCFMTHLRRTHTGSHIRKLKYNLLIIENCKRLKTWITINLTVNIIDTTSAGILIWTFSQLCRPIPLCRPYSGRKTPGKKRHACMMKKPGSSCAPLYCSIAAPKHLYVHVAWCL